MEKQLEEKTDYFGLQSQKDRVYCGQKDTAKVRESKETQARNGLISFLSTHRKHRERTGSEVTRQSILQARPNNVLPPAILYLLKVP